MLTSTVRLTDNFDGVRAEIRRRSLHALNEAAAVAAREADARANHSKPIARVAVVPARGTENGFSSGVKLGPLARIFDKGSLGQHEGRLKRARKASWEVGKGANPYVAHRHDDLAGKGVAARKILTSARSAGRKALIRSLSR